MLGQRCGTVERSSSGCGLSGVVERRRDRRVGTLDREREVPHTFLVVRDDFRKPGMQRALARGGEAVDGGSEERVDEVHGMTLDVDDVCFDCRLEQGCRVFAECRTQDRHSRPRECRRKGEGVERRSGKRNESTLDQLTKAGRDGQRCALGQ